MARGSQLKQLKSSAHQTKVDKGGKKKKKSSAGPAKKESQKINMFDLKVTKLKHDVGGRKVKGRIGKPALKNQAGLEQRKKSLLSEIGRRGKVGGILDRRFGENDPTMSLEERMLERFTRERQRASKNSVFNLDDDTELTHYGQSLSNMDDFDAIPMDSDHEDDDEDEKRRGQLDAKTVSVDHFGGFEDDEAESEEAPRKKSKAEVMAEVIAKSKEHKLQRQMENEREEQMRHELDADFKSIQSFFTQSKDEQPSTSSALPAKAEKSYDQIVHELAFDARSKPKDRTKTEEELAIEQKEELERAERRRMRRMNGEDDFDSEEEEGTKKWKRKRKRGKEESDEEDEGESDDPDSQWPNLGKGLAGKDVESEDEDEDESEEEVEVEVEVEDSEDNSEEEESNSPTELPTKSRAGASSISKGKGKATVGTDELPFTYPCPTSHEEWLDLVEDYDSDQTATVVQRILTLYHPSLGAENPEKLQTFLEVLIDHVLYATAPPEPDFALVDRLFLAIVKLTRLYPTRSANAFKAKLSLMEKNLQKGLSLGPERPESKTFPGTSELALLRLIGSIWSTSDQRHPVVQPAMLLMGAYLELGRVRSLKDLASGLFVSTLFLQYETFSKRLVPEAISFLLNTVLLLSPSAIKEKSQSPDFLFGLDLWAPVQKKLRLRKVADLVPGESKEESKFIPKQPNLPALISEAITYPKQAKIDLLSVALKLLEKFGVFYQGLDSSVELLGGMASVVSSLEIKNCSSELQQIRSDCETTIAKSLKLQKLARRPLLLQSHKPVPIATYAPKFSQTNSSYLRAQDPDRERAASAKLRREYKQERKGALRELRRDAQFLAREKQERQAEKDAAYNLSMKRTMGSIEVERAEEKRMQKDKMREKKRAGRK